MFARRHLVALLTASLVAAGFGVVLPAQSGAVDPSLTYSLSQGSGGATGAYLRMHHPLYLLDLVRQVRSGAMDRSTVASIVGGTAILDGLLATDLDALYARLTAPQDVRTVRPSLWQQIVTRGGTAGPLLPDPPPDVDLGQLTPGETRSELVVATAASDGLAFAAVPAGSPVRILSIRTLDGQIVSAPPIDSAAPVGIAALLASPGDGNPFLMPASSRTRAPWLVAVQAGQEIAVEIDIPGAASMPPGDISTSVLVGDLGGAWFRNVVVSAKVAPLPVPGGGVYIYVSQPLGTMKVIRPPSYQPGVKIPFTLPLTLTCCYPQVDASGTITLTSAPAGVSMSPVNFSIAAGQTITIPLTIELDTLGSAWFSPDYMAQGFAVSLVYRSVPLAAAGFGSGIVSKTFTLYPGSKNWSSKGNAGPMDCQEDVSLFSSGTIAISSTCGNYNIFPGKSAVDLFLGQAKVFSTAYSLNPYERQFATLSYTSQSYQANFLTWIAQPLMAARKGCLLCNF